MKVEIKKILWPSIISSLVLLILGLLLFFKSAATLMSISYIIGGILFALGIIAIIRFITREYTDVFNQLNIVYGVICILSGIFFIKEPEILGGLMPFCLGIGIIVSSSIKMQQALILRNLNSRYWSGSLITALLCLICGVILLFNPFKGAVVITKIIGLFLAIYAILDIINTIFLRKGDTISIEVGPVREKEERKKKKTKDATIIKEVNRKQEDQEE